MSNKLIQNIISNINYEMNKKLATTFSLPISKLDQNPIIKFTQIDSTNIKLYLNLISYKTDLIIEIPQNNNWTKQELTKSIYMNLVFTLFTIQKKLFSIDENIINSNQGRYFMLTWATNANLLAVLMAIVLLFKHNNMREVEALSSVLIAVRNIKEADNAQKIISNSNKKIDDPLYELINLMHQPTFVKTAALNKINEKIEPNMLIDWMNQFLAHPILKYMLSIALAGLNYHYPKYVQQMSQITSKTNKRIANDLFLLQLIITSSPVVVNGAFIEEVEN